MDPELQTYFINQAVEACQDGDHSEYKVIVDTFDNRLYRIAWLITRDYAFAEDAVQETFIRGWRHLKTFKPGTRLDSWLTRILINYLSKQRRRNRIPQVPVSEAMNVRDSEPSVERQVFSSETMEELWTVVGELPEVQRIVVTLRFLDDLSLNEIAEATGWRLGTVKSRLHRAMSNLRVFMTAEETLGVPVREDR